MTELLKRKQGSNNIYQPMLDDILGGISKGELVLGDRLPSEKELAANYKISINSVRRGIAELGDKGIIKSRRGSGMYIASSEMHPSRNLCLDSIAVLFDTQIEGYHPYYSELRKGVTESLIQKGWRLWYPDQYSGNKANDDERIIYPNMNERIAMFHQKGEFAGAVCSQGHASRIAAEANYDCPIVLPIPSDQFSFVAYDWDDELVRLIRSVIKDGAKNILFVTSSGRTNYNEWIELACLTERSTTKPNFSTIQLPTCRNYYMLTKETYKLTETFLQENNNFDAVVVDSDFAAQGVLDAFFANSELDNKDISFALMKNRLFKLNSPFAYSAVIIDGHEQGSKLGSLLHDKITMPENAAKAVCLQGDLVKQ